ncbi:MAG TPA: L,D-transpeptidase [Hyphomicrobiaceae bacterium]|nr:L,D-transpeptidase [Hyphomicrobiaceae bacterium]
MTAAWTRRTALVAASLCLSLVSPTPSLAQGWPAWADDVFATGRASRPEPRREFGIPAQPTPSERPLAKSREPSLAADGDVRDGGPRPDIAPVAPATVAFEAAYPANSIVIDTGARALYYVLPDKQAYRYPISVGREGFNWTGTETISRKQAWPDWYPPAEMRERDPRLPEKMTGGTKNPLGAMALYLGNSLYRIHGTNDVKSIGQAQSSGCFRMLNGAVLHLAQLAEVGTSVTVVSALPAAADVSQATPPVPAIPEAALEPAPQASPAPAEAGDRMPDYRSLRDFALQPR